MDRLKGKVAIVTGAANGIGDATARLFAAEGAEVAIVDVDDENGQRVAGEIRTAGNVADFWHLDVSEAAEVERVFTDIFNRYHQINILVNNLGINPKLTFLLDIEESIWDRVMETNLKGYLLASQIGGRNMRDHGGGIIINISSFGGIQPAPAGGAYCISKAGVNMLTKVMAQEMARYSIRVNAICPGLIRTEFSRTLWEDPKNLSFRVVNSAMRRIGEPEEVAGMALYLAADASSFVTGDVLLVTGGRI